MVQTYEKLSSFQTETFRGVTYLSDFPMNFTEILIFGIIPLKNSTENQLAQKKIVSKNWLQIEMEIRAVGAIPVKNRRGDPIVWMPTTAASTSATSVTSATSATSGGGRRRQKDVDIAREKDVVTIQVPIPQKYFLTNMRTYFLQISVKLILPNLYEYLQFLSSLFYKYLQNN
jgi:hypothetical protein